MQNTCENHQEQFMYCSHKEEQPKGAGDAGEQRGWWPIDDHQRIIYFHERPKFRQPAPCTSHKHTHTHTVWSSYSPCTRTQHFSHAPCICTLQTSCMHLPAAPHALHLQRAPFTRTPDPHPWLYHGTPLQLYLYHAHAPFAPYPCPSAPYPCPSAPYPVPRRRPQQTRCTKHCNAPIF